MTRPDIPAALSRGFHDPAFWARWNYTDDHRFLVGGPLQAVFTLGDGYELVLTADDDLGDVFLSLKTPSSSEPAYLGFDDQAHLNPEILRWADLEFLARLQALGNPALPHPGPVVLLLARFAPVCDDTDAALAFPLLAASWEWTGVDGGNWWERADRRGAGFVWKQRTLSAQRDAVIEDTNRDWVDLCAVRADDFPHTELADAFVAAERSYRDSLPVGWRTADVWALAAAAVADLSVAPVLADALDDAGCDRPDLLAALRSCDPTRAGWVAEWLLGDRSGDAVRRAYGPAPAPLPLPPEADA